MKTTHAYLTFWQITPENTLKGLLNGKPHETAQIKERDRMWATTETGRVYKLGTEQLHWT